MSLRKAAPAARSRATASSSARPPARCGPAARLGLATIGMDLDADAWPRQPSEAIACDDRHRRSVRWRNRNRDCRHKRIAASTSARYSARSPISLSVPTARQRQMLNMASDRPEQPAVPVTLAPTFCPSPCSRGRQHRRFAETHEDRAHPPFPRLIAEIVAADEAWQFSAQRSRFLSSSGMRIVSLAPKSLV